MEMWIDLCWKTVIYLQQFKDSLTTIVITHKTHMI